MSRFNGPASPVINNTIPVDEWEDMVFAANYKAHFGCLAILCRYVNSTLVVVFEMKHALTIQPYLLHDQIRKRKRYFVYGVRLAP